MSRALNVSVSAQIASSQRKPVLLFEVSLGSGTTLYWAASNADITFPSGGGGTLYQAKAIRFSGIEQSTEGQINAVTVDFDNASGDMSAYLAVAALEGNPLVVKRVYQGDMGNAANYVEVFHGTMEEPEEIGRYWVPVKATAGRPLFDRMLLDSYQRQCRHSFGDAQCNYDGLANLASAAMFSTGQVISGGTNFIIMKTVGVEGPAGVTGTNDDIFNFGLIQVGLSGTTYNRYCSDYISATSRAEWLAGTPAAIDNTYRFIVYKGCDKTWAACSRETYAWGPSGNNTDNFGGFLHIGIREET